MTDSESLANALADLTAEDQARVREYIAFLRWRNDQTSAAAPAAGHERTWRFSFLEHFGEADISASRDAQGMEVKIGEATVGGERRPALWLHPPVLGEAVVEFHAPIPVGLRKPGVRLRFSIGIRDGAQAGDGLVAFRVRVGGWQIWSRAAWPIVWQPFEIGLPFQSGDVLRLAFATDALGSHPFAWAVWGEPELIGAAD